MWLPLFLLPPPRIPSPLLLFLRMRLRCLLLFRPALCLLLLPLPLLLLLFLLLLLLDRQSTDGSPLHLYPLLALLLVQPAVSQHNVACLVISG